MSPERTAWLLAIRYRRAARIGAICVPAGSSGVRQARGAYHAFMGRASDGVLSPAPHYHQILGRAAEIARALASPAGGAEHLFLGMLHDGGWPVSVISPLADLGQAEAAVLGIVNSPGYSPPPAPRLPVPHGYVQPWGAASGRQAVRPRRYSTGGLRPARPAST